MQHFKNYKGIQILKTFLQNFFLFFSNYIDIIFKTPNWNLTRET